MKLLEVKKLLDGEDSTNHQPPSTEHGALSTAREGWRQEAGGAEWEEEEGALRAGVAAAAAVCTAALRWETGWSERQGQLREAGVGAREGGSGGGALCGSLIQVAGAGFRSLGGQVWRAG